MMKIQVNIISQRLKLLRKLTISYITIKRLTKKNIAYKSLKNFGLSILIKNKKDIS